MTSARLITTSTTRARLTLGVRPRSRRYCAALLRHGTRRALGRPVVSLRARHLDDHAAGGSLRRSGVHRGQRFAGLAACELVRPQAPGASTGGRA